MRSHLPAAGLKFPPIRRCRSRKARYFDHDLIGCAVQDLSGKQIGIVSEVLHFAGNNQLVVKDPGREFLIPAVESICVQISIGDKQITIDPPEGLMDLDK